MKNLSVIHLTIALLTSSCITSPAIAQRMSPELYRQYSSGVVHLNFSAQPNLCKGQILDQGLICVLDFSEQKKPEKRVAVMRLGFDMDQFFATAITIRTFEMEPNSANVAYKIVIRRYVAATKSDLPLLLGFVKKDGSISLDTTYGDFPPQLSREQESFSVLKEHKGAIQKLITALNKTR